MFHRVILLAILQVWLIEYTVGVVPQITRLNVQCDRTGMKVNVDFDIPFNGIIFSKGHYSDANCRYVSPNLQRASYNFFIPSTQCGTISTDARRDGTLGFKNVIIIQNDPEYQEVWDMARKISCDWVTRIDKYVTFAPFGVDMLGIKEIQFPGDTVDCWMDIQRGHGPFAPAIAGVVPIGEKLTIVIYIRDKDSSFDIHVKDCYAYDSPDYKNPNVRAIQLTDARGCPIKQKLVKGFYRTRDVRNSGATIIAYGVINAFKFPEAMDVFLACNVEVCKGGCENPCQPEVTMAGGDAALDNGQSQGPFTRPPPPDSQVTVDPDEGSEATTMRNEVDTDEGGEDTSGQDAETTAGGGDTSGGSEETGGGDTSSETEGEGNRSTNGETPTEGEASSGGDSETSGGDASGGDTSGGDASGGDASGGDASGGEEETTESPSAETTSAATSDAEESSETEERRAAASNPARIAVKTRAKKSSRRHTSPKTSAKLTSLKQRRGKQTPKASSAKLVRNNSGLKKRKGRVDTGRGKRGKRSILITGSNGTFSQMTHSISIISPVEDFDENELEIWQRAKEGDNKVCFSALSLITSSIILTGLAILFSMSLLLSYGRLRQRYGEKSFS